MRKMKDVAPPSQSFNCRNQTTTREARSRCKAAEAPCARLVQPLGSRFHSPTTRLCGTGGGEGQRPCHPPSNLVPVREDAHILSALNGEHLGPGPRRRRRWRRGDRGRVRQGGWRGQGADWTDHSTGLNAQQFRSVDSRCRIAPATRPLTGPQWLRGASSTKKGTSSCLTRRQCWPSSRNSLAMSQRRCPS